MSNFNKGSQPVVSRRSKNLAILAIMLALTIFFCFVPISFPGGVTLALMILPLLVVAQGYDFKMTIVLAIMLACVNQIAWYTTKAGGPMAPIWQNPVVCMLPRIAIGVVSYFVGLGIRKLFLRPKYKIEGESKTLLNQKKLFTIDYIATTVSTAFGVFTNTFLCGLFTVLLYDGTSISENTKISVEYILTWFGVNFVIEIIAFSIIVPPIIMALRKAKLIPNPKFGKEIIIKENNLQSEVSEVEISSNEKNFDISNTDESNTKDNNQ